MVLIRAKIFSDAKFIEIEEPFIKILEHPLMQRLRWIDQFGIYTSIIFHDAKRSRFSHALGCFELADRITNHLEQKEELDEFQALHLKLAALIHDLFHPPGSHATEAVLGRHDKIEYYLKLRREIEKCGFDFDYTLKLLSEKVPESKILFGKVIGIDFLEYSFGDAPLFGTNPPVGPDVILPFLEFDGKFYGVDSRIAEELIKLGNFRADMFATKYRRKGCELLERLFQKMVKLLLNEYKVEEIRKWRDFELLSALAKSKYTKDVFEEVFSQRKLPKQVVAIKIEGYEKTVVKRGKPMYVCSASFSELERLEKKLLKEKEELEKEIASLINCDWRRVVVTTPHYKAPSIRNGIPEEDVTLFEGSNRRSLFGLYPHYRSALKEMYAAHYTIRIGVPEKYRRKCAKLGRKIENLMFNF